jgi:nucleoside-diphosphate-sugar epimerase
LALERGADVHCVSRISPVELEGATVHRLDLLATGAATELIRSVKPTHVVHAAWETAHGNYWNDPINMDWIEVTARMGKAFADADGERFVQVGTGAEYDWSHGMCIEQVTPEQPATRYGWAKLAAYHAVEAAALDAFEVVDARIFFAYGPGEHPDRYIPYICRCHAQGLVPELSSGRKWRDVLFVEDVAAAIVVAVEARGVVGPVNIGGGMPVSLEEVATILARVAGTSETGLGRLPDRIGDPTVLLPSVDKLLATGWSPRHTLDEGLAATYDWWRKRVT